MLYKGWLYYNAETDGGDFITCKYDINHDWLELEADFPVNPDYDFCYSDGFLYYFSDGTLYKKDVRTEVIS